MEIISKGQVWEVCSLWSCSAQRGGAAHFHICNTGKTWPDLRNQKKYWEKIKLFIKKKKKVKLDDAKELCTCSVGLQPCSSEHNVVPKCTCFCS